MEADDPPCRALLRQEARLGAAVGKLDDVEAPAALGIGEKPAHPLAVLEPVPAPPPAERAEHGREGPAARPIAAPPDDDAVALLDTILAARRAAGEHLHMMAERREGARLRPGVGTDPAEAGVGRILVREEGDPHRGSNSRH